MDKSLQRVEIKSAERGEVSAVFSTFNVIDHDGDVTFPGAFTDGAEVIISAYKHQTNVGGALPVGTGRIRQTKSEAVLDGRFFLETDSGREHFAVVKALGPRQEWSYGYDVLNPPEQVTFAGRKANALRKLHVSEVSPVFRGAGINTRTLAVKSLTDAGLSTADAVRFVERNVVSDYRAAIHPHETPVTVKAWNGPAAVDALASDAKVDDLRAVFAWCDADGDPTVKSSYRFPHHDAPGGPANLRACLVGIATLNGVKSGIPEADRQGVYNHLAAHLEDGDRDVPGLRAEGDSAPLKFHDEAVAVMAGVSSLLDRASEVMALRATKGKSIAAASVDLLEWLHDDLRRVRTLLDTPQEDAAREYARFVQAQMTRGETA